MEAWPITHSSPLPAAFPLGLQGLYPTTLSPVLPQANNIISL